MYDPYWANQESQKRLTGLLCSDRKTRGEYEEGFWFAKLEDSEWSKMFPYFDNRMIDPEGTSLMNFYPMDYKTGAYIIVGDKDPWEVLVTEMIVWPSRTIVSQFS